MTHALNFCLKEDRPVDAIGLKLAILSLERHEPQARVHLFAAAMPAAFLSWAAKRPNVDLHADVFDNLKGWNNRPYYILSLLDAGLSEVVWMDHDIILTAPIRHHFSNAAEELFIATEEPILTPAMARLFGSRKGPGSLPRTAAWGLRPGNRPLASTVNAGIMRVTESHRPLFEAWLNLLARPDYVAAQSGPYEQRPYHMVGSQDSLTALLGSDRFQDLPVKLLRRGRDIAQCFQSDGYSVAERLANLARGLPPMVHAMGQKPWRNESQSVPYLDLSPYRYAARAFSDHLSDKERRWMKLASATSRICDFLALGNPNLAGLPPAAAQTVSRWSGRFARLAGVLAGKMSHMVKALRA